MSKNTLWVLGHRIRPIETDGSYGMVEIVSPPHVPGPPPHFHKSEQEFFLIIKGTLNVMRDGVWEKVQAGSFVELPPHTVHTFINDTDEDVVWITGWRPKGFQKFFEDFGFPEAEPNSREQSTSQSIIRNVVERVESYGMYISG